MVLLRETLWWLDAVPARFWTVAWLAGGLTVALAWFPVPSAPRRSALLFGLAVLLTLGAFRWPTWFYPVDLNPDESQIVAGALTLERFPVYWKYVDGTTHGPLCEYPLVVAGWLGAPFNYATARIVAALLQAGALLATWRTLRLFAPERTARVALLPGLAFWCLVPWDDFLHYSTELPGIFLLCLAIYGLAVVFAESTTSRWRLGAMYFAGMCLGAVPYGKLQSVPQAAACTLLAVILLWRTGSPVRTKQQLGAVLFLGGMTPSLIVAAFLTVYGLWNQFHAAYIESALAYMQVSTPFFEMPGKFFNFSATSPAFAWFFWGTLGFSLLYLRGPWKPGHRQVCVAISWLLLLAAYLSVIRPGRESAHYLHLLVTPLILLAGFTFARATDDAPGMPGRQRVRVLLAFVGLIFVPQVFDHVNSQNRFVGHARQHWETPPSAAAGFISERAQAGDTLAMWGWEPHLLVETQLPHGTREAHSAGQIMQWPMTAFYVERYLHDLRRTKPAWFVDAVGPDAFVFSDRANHAHETIPGLRDWIATHYTLATEIGNKRIYRLQTVP
jgi:hypothetical protein